jgi:hypothetical protein
VNTEQPRGSVVQSPPGGSTRLRDAVSRYGALALPALGTLTVAFLAGPAARDGGVGAAPFAGWNLLPPEVSPGWRAAAGAIWLLILALPAGVMAPSAAPRLAAWFGVGAAGVVAAAAVMPGAHLTWLEAAIMAAGFGAGLALRRAAAADRLVPLLALFAAMAFVLLLTLVPREGSPALSSPRLSILGGRRGGADALANIALFIPLGMALAGAKLRLWQAVAAAALVSLCVEAAQYWIPGRSPALGDVAMNTLGGLTGWLLLPLAAVIWRRRRAPVALTVLVSVIAPAGIAATGWLLTPVVQDGEYRVQWAAPRRNMETYGGRLTAVRVGDHPLPAGTHLGLTDLFREGFLAGSPLLIEGTAGPRTSRASPLLRVVVRRGEPPRARETLAVIASGDDALLRIGRRSRQYRLFEPTHRLRGAFGAVAAGEPLHIEVRREGRYWCFRAGETASCRLAFGVGDGWALLVSSAGMPGPVRAALQGTWILLLAVPIGLVAPRNFRHILLHASGMGVAIALAVWYPGTLVLRGWEAGLLVTAYFSAWAVKRVRHAPPRPWSGRPAETRVRAVTAAQ